MKKYTFEVEIEEANDEFWEDLKGTGCDLLRDSLDDCISNEFGYSYKVKLVRFTDD